MEVVGMATRHTPRHKRPARFRPPRGLTASTGIRRTVAQGAPLELLVQRCYQEIMRLVDEGRVPAEAAEEAVAMASSELADRRAEASVSWSDSQAPCFEEHEHRAAPREPRGLGWRRGQR